MISPPLLGLIQVSEDTWCQVYSQFYVLYKAGTTLEISAVQGEPPQGKQVPEVSVCRQSRGIWRLFRLGRDCSKGSI